MEERGRRDPPPQMTILVWGGGVAGHKHVLSQHHPVHLVVTFHPAQSQVPALLLWLVSSVLYQTDFKHSEMSHADFSWE